MSIGFKNQDKGGGRQVQNDIARLNGRSELEAYQTRVWWLLLAFLMPFLAIVGRLWQIQVLDADEMGRKARNNLVRTVEIPADRGLIFDRTGAVIADNRVAYDVVVDPIHFKGEPEALELLRTFLNLAQSDVNRIQRQLAGAGNRTFVARRDVSRDQVALLETHQLRLPGVSVQTRAHRYYPFNELASHTLGFMNEVTSEELARLGEFGYRPGDYVGRTGLERASEPILRGSPGFSREVVDARGMPQGEDVAEELLGHYRRVEPVPGRNIVLTLDMELQQIMLEAFAAHASGAAVAIDPRDGSVLGLLSKPTFNPNSWTGRLSVEEKIQSDKDPFKPMIDKTVKTYFPGSTFKLVTALAALHEGFIQPDETLRCNGFYEFGGRRFHCWNRGGHGLVDLTDSLKHSCDVYYYKLGEKLGMDTLAQYAYMFGFGERTGVGINGEQRGLVPTKDWHRKNSPEGFQHGFTLSTSVGQGDTKVTPLQLALSFAVLANRGTLHYPRLVDRIESAEGAVLFTYPARGRSVLEVPTRLFDQIDVGMTAVVSEPGGTAYKHHLSYVNLAGKTGTAQVRGFDKMQLGQDGEVILEHRDHSWFVAYGPVEAPRIVLVVFVEHGGSGGKVAAPLAMGIMDRYFREVEGMDPEAEAASAVASEIGPRRLRRSAEEEEGSAWRRPDEDVDLPADQRVIGVEVGDEARRRLDRGADDRRPSPPDGSGGDKPAPRGADEPLGPSGLNRPPSN